MKVENAFGTGQSHATNGKNPLSISDLFGNTLYYKAYIEGYNNPTMAHNPYFYQYYDKTLK